MKEFFKSLFGASSKEIIGFSALIIIILISLGVPGVIRNLTIEEDSYLSKDAKILDSLVVLIEHDRTQRRLNSQKEFDPHPFNPNEATQAELVELGFKEYIAQRIVNYRGKGGSFRLKSDLYKIYGIDSLLVEALSDFIDLPEKRIAKEIKRPEQDKSDKSAKRPKTTVVELPDFDINNADTSVLQTIKGIGSVLSKRIIDFRSRLGGFMQTNQLYEVYNLDSVVVTRLIDKSYIQPTFTPTRLLINQVSEKELATHPYISWQQARLILAYRNQHGDFNSGQDLLNVYGVEEIDINRLISYLDWTPSN